MSEKMVRTSSPVIGFQREGIFEYYCHDGAYTDQIAFSLLRKEWDETS